MKIYDFFYEEISPGVQRVRGFFPEGFVGLQTTRVGGVSVAPFESFNLAGHVGDSLEAVEKNRARLSGVLPGEAVWLEQVHGCESIVIARNAEGVTWQSACGGSPRAFGPRDDNQTVIASEAKQSIRADASFTAEADQPCAVMTADCLPLLVARPSTGQCAAIHAGWKGLAAGVIEKTLSKLKVSDTLISVPDTWYIWLGPAIGPQAFEVGPEVREKFVQLSDKAAAAFTPSPKRAGHYMASLAQLALLRLTQFEQQFSGVNLNVAIDSQCVFDSPDQYFSFRRDPITGRMASLIFRRMTIKA